MSNQTTQDPQPPRQPPTAHTSMDATRHGTSSPEWQEDMAIEKIEPVPASQGNWFVRNKLKASLLAGAVLAVLAIAIAVPISASNQPSSWRQGRRNDGGYGYPNMPRPSSNSTSSGGGGGNADDDALMKNFDDSAQANPHVPPLKEAFKYGEQPIRGVNLGGWLVIEPFITPSLFDQFDPKDNVVDEWGLCSKLGPEKAREQLEHHYETFITEDDFRKMRDMGMNHVRIPTGHWAVQPVEGEPFVPKLAWKYLLRGIQWARKYGLRVMVELHTAPGSQNGWNHSGRYGQVRWLNGTDGEHNAELTLQVVKKMTEFFSKPEWSHVTPVFGVLNEPAIFRLERERVEQWYHQSHDVIRNITGKDQGPLLTYHDGFLGMNAWNGFFKDPSFNRVILETHTYLIFDDGLVSMPRDKQAAFPCQAWNRDIGKSMAENGPTMVGEFSMATNDCGKYLNGVRLGARYEGTLTEGNSKIGKPVCDTCTCKGVDDWKNWDDDYKKFLHEFIERQMDAFETGYGWFFWTYKTEEHINPHWDYLLGWEQGWIPKDVNERTYSCKEIPPSED